MALWLTRPVSLPRVNHLQGIPPGVVQAQITLQLQGCLELEQETFLGKDRLEQGVLETPDRVLKTLRDVCQAVKGPLEQAMLQRTLQFPDLIPQF